ncbi:unnamed protein product [Effrenium voratum]|nr:unnamed protein product [Effrenium voratum]
MGFALVALTLIASRGSGENCSDCEDAWLVQARAPSRPGPWQSPRDLATVVPPAPMPWGDVELQFLSAIPVFGKGTNYIALLHDYHPGFWDYATKHRLFCASSDGSHKAALKLWGGEIDRMKRTIAFHCPWPQEAADGNYHLIVQSEEGMQLGEIRTKQTPNLLGRHGAIACIAVAWNEPGMKPTSTRAPQWLEYSLMHGVGHFLLYTQDGMDEEFLRVYRPYLEQGLATRIHITPVKTHFEHYHAVHHSTHNWVANDCLYRAKHHARWVLPTIDWDEYLIVKEGAPARWHGPNFMANLWDQVAAEASLTHNEVHAVMLSRYQFAVSPASELDTTSTLRERKVARKLLKYVVNPDVVNSVFVHWPTSWAEGTFALKLKRGVASLNHYRLSEEEVGEGNGMVRDEALVPEVPAIANALRARFGKPWEKLMLELTPVTAANPPDDFYEDVPVDGLEFDDGFEYDDGFEFDD